MPDPYAAWAAGVRAGTAIVTNGPLVEIETDQVSARATASFYRPLLRLEIVHNGQVVASAEGDGKSTSLSASANLPQEGSFWMAARVKARKEPGEPDIQAHTNPVYLFRKGIPALIPEARRALATRWKAELDWYRTGPLVFGKEATRREFFEKGERALRILSSQPGSL